MISLITEAIALAAHLGGENDMADKLSCRYTIFLLIYFFVLCCAKQYVGEPIVCIVPGASDAFSAYMHNMCWIKNTYYVPPDQQILPVTDEEARDLELMYYQWVPFVILLQVVFFYAPHVFWTVLNVCTGCDVASIVQLYSDHEMIEDGIRHKSIQCVTNHMDKFLRARRQPNVAAVIESMVPGQKSRTISLRFRGSELKDRILDTMDGVYLTIIYGLTKLMYLTNCGVQLILLNAVLGRDYYVYGVELLKDIASGLIITESHRFPYATLCDMRYRAFGNVAHRRTFNCLLTINFLNEKVYSLLWFWLVFVGCVSFMSLLSWVWGQLTPVRVSTCSLWLEQAKAPGERIDENLVKRFATEYLRYDGLLVLQLVRRNVNDIIAAETLMSLYKRYVHSKTFQGDNGKLS